MKKNPEPTRTRQGGTRVTTPLTGDQRIAAFRKIVEEKQYAKIDGCMVDLFSASAVVQVYDALSPENQKKYAGYTADKMAKIAFGLIKKSRGG